MGSTHEPAGPADAADTAGTTGPASEAETAAGSSRPPILDGIKIVEFAHLIAGPLAGTLMADLGAEVVHVEDPTLGDPSRRMGPHKDGVYLWWKVAGRNKRSVTLDLRSPDGQDLARELVGWADVVITNFRVETLERWGLDWERLHQANNKLVMLQVSANGADTTRRNEPGFGKVGEARSGVVNITGFADGPPVHTGFSHADSVTALMGAFAITAALSRRGAPDFAGEWIDLALFESLFRLIEWQIVVYDQLGQVPTRLGNQLFVAPGSVVNTHRTADGDWITVTSATPRSVSNVAELLGEPAEDFATVELQQRNKARLNDGLRHWIGERTAEECLAEMGQLGVVASRIYDIEDILADRTYEEREDIVTVDDPDLGPLRMQGVVPKLTNHPGAVRHSAPALGTDNDVVYEKYLGYSPEQLDALRSRGVI